jgi:hypothetical protein
MKVFFDCEFTGLHKDTTLISIALISEDDRTFYAEFNDYDENQVNDWIEKNVINNLIYGKNDFNLFADKVVSGNFSSIRQSLLQWLDQFDSIEWVSDVCHYDFVLLIDLLCGEALDMPDHINCVCHDINQDIAKHYNISEYEAFNKSREKILSDNKIKINGDKHNSLYDAKVIKEIYKIVK